MASKSKNSGTSQGGGLISYKDLDRAEVSEVGSGSNITVVLYNGLKDLEPNTGRKFGPFKSEREAKKVRPKIGLVARSLGWDTGLRTPTGKRSTPYTSDVVQEPDGWHLRIVRKPQTDQPVDDDAEYEEEDEN